jgi:hypothetical protein
MNFDLNVFDYLPVGDPNAPDAYYILFNDRTWMMYHMNSTFSVGVVHGCERGRPFPPYKAVLAFETP